MMDELYDQFETLMLETDINSDFQHMMGYSYFDVALARRDVNMDVILKGISDIIDSAKRLHFEEMMIRDMPLTSFVLIIDDIHFNLARERENYDSYVRLFHACLGTLVQRHLIPENPLEKLKIDPWYYQKYWPNQQ